MSYTFNITLLLGKTEENHKSKPVGQQGGSQCTLWRPQYEGYVRDEEAIGGNFERRKIVICVICILCHNITKLKKVEDMHF
jgi:hypothetical protein